MTHEALSFLTKLRLHYGNPAEAVLPGIPNRPFAEELYEAGLVERDVLLPLFDEGSEIRFSYRINDAGYTYLRNHEFSGDAR